jgi:hypothetical protein
MMITFKNEPSFLNNMRWGFHRGHAIMYISILIAIAIGWTGHSIYIDFSNTWEKVPAIPGEKSTFERITSALTFGAAETISPGDHISEDQIRVYDDRVVLVLDNPTWSTFTNTNSMDPVLDKGANGIEVKPKSEQDISVGDVISYKTRDNRIVIHRVIDISSDEKGIYYTMKGDNNPTADAERVRFKNVMGILVAVVY